MFCQWVPTALIVWLQLFIYLNFIIQPIEKTKIGVIDIEIVIEKTKIRMIDIEIVSKIRMIDVERSHKAIKIWLLNYQYKSDGRDPKEIIIDMILWKKSCHINQL